jgi:hypothetical protein
MAITESRDLATVAVLAGTFDGLRSAVTQQRSFSGAEFVALGMTTEIVVIVQDENASVFVRAFAIEIGGREPADSAAHNDEVMFLASVGRIAERVRIFAVAQAVGKGEASIVISAQGHFCGWVIIRHFFWRELIESTSG